MRLSLRTLQNALDLAILSAAYWAAYLLRFDATLPPQIFKRVLFMWPYVVGFEFTVLYLFAVHRFAWRYISLKEAQRVLWATVAIAVPLLLARYVAGLVLARHGEAQYALIPGSVIVVNMGLTLIGIVGVRALRRVSAERESAKMLARSPDEMLPVLLVGAGQAGAQIARELEKRPDLGFEPVGFLDDDQRKIGSTVHGIPVLGTIYDLSKVAKRLGVRQIIVTIADLEPKALRRIVERCESERLRVKILPGLYQLIDDSAALGKLRDVSIEDLLGRDAVKLDMELIGAFLTGKRVLVTGAGGSIGSELCRQVAQFAPESLTLVERSEFALFTIHQELLKSFPHVRMVPRICDISDVSRLGTVFTEDRPQVVFHAAAHKHVPMMEYNPGEAIKNNIFGTKAVADAANHHNCDAFVMISTDKAVNPTSIMGATKRVAEMYVQALSSRSKTKYVAVRFGNVLGSTGSVVPTFKAQIAAGGPLSVTHPDMVRYFMTIPEASQLVMQAASMGTGGEIFVLDMGEPVKIVDLANDLIRLSGLVPGVDIQVEFTGMRPGEKLFEELGFDGEKMNKTAHPKIFIGRLAPSPLAQIESSLAQLSAFGTSTSAADVRKALKMVVPEMLSEKAIPLPATKPKSAPNASPAAIAPIISNLAGSSVR